MKNISLLLSVIFIALSSCSNSEESNPTNSDYFQDLVVIANTDSQVSRVDISNNGNTINDINLTTSQGVEPNFDFAELNHPNLNIFDRPFGANYFSLYRSNILTSQSQVVNEICELQVQEYAIYPAASNNNVVLFTSRYNTSENMSYVFAQVYNQETNNCTEIPLGAGELYPYSSSYVDGEVLYIYKSIHNQQYDIIRVNLATSQIEATITLDGYFSCTIKDNALLVFYNNDRLEVYNKATLQLESSQNINFYVSHFSGFFKANFLGNEMVTYIPYAQPSVVNGALGTIDISTGELVRGNNGYMYDIKQNLDLHYAQTGGTTAYTAFAVDIASNEVIVGFRRYDANNMYLGGILYSNFDGDIRHIVELNALPSHIFYK